MHYVSAVKILKYKNFPFFFFFNKWIIGNTINFAQRRGSDPRRYSRENDKEVHTVYYKKDASRLDVKNIQVERTLWCEVYNIELCEVRKLWYLRKYKSR